MEKVKITMDNQEYEIVTKVDDEDKQDEFLIENDDLDNTINIEELMSNNNE